MTKKQLEQISSLRKIIVDDNGYAFLELKRDGNIFKAENEDYSLDIDSVETKANTQWDIFGDICERIVKDTYPNHKFDYENAVAHKRRIVFSYMINEHQTSMECTMNVKKLLGL